MIFADQNGPLDVDAPNKRGWADAVAFIEGTQSAALNELAREGSTENLNGLVKDLNSLQSDDDDVQEVLDALEEAALEAEGILIVSEG
jgi:SepF-like predicted cell division protein (DUF552 family)